MQNVVKTMVVTIQVLKDQGLITDEKLHKAHESLREQGRKAEEAIRDSNKQDAGGGEVQSKDAGANEGGVGHDRPSLL